MSTKTIQSRVLLKTGTCNDWEVATIKSNFTPLLGEICVYTDKTPVFKEGSEEIDYYIPGIKIGDGVKNINDLPFAEEEAISKNTISEITGMNIIDGKRAAL